MAKGGILIYGILLIYFLAILGLGIFIVSYLSKVVTLFPQSPIFVFSFEKTEKPAETTTLKIFFNNSEFDPEASCNKVFPVERTVLKTQTPARRALELLFEGPSVSEKNQEFFTSIPRDVKINSLTIENGIAKADFNETLEFQVGGSCRVSAIRSQITQTLKQFSSVKDVIISIEGRTEDILQP